MAKVKKNFHFFWIPSLIISDTKLHCDPTSYIFLTEIFVVKEGGGDTSKFCNIFNQRQVFLGQIVRATKQQEQQKFFEITGPGSSEGATGMASITHCTGRSNHLSATPRRKETKKSNKSTNFLRSLDP